MARHDPQGACPVCGHAIAGEPLFCLTCDTPHHSECWQFFGRCATFACGGTASTRQMPPPSPMITVTGLEPGVRPAAPRTGADTGPIAWVRLGTVGAPSHLQRLIAAFNGAGIRFLVNDLNSAGLPTIDNITGHRSEILVPAQEHLDARALIHSEELPVRFPRPALPADLVNFPRGLAACLIGAVLYPPWLPLFGLGALLAVCGRDILRFLFGRWAGPHAGPDRDV